MLTIKFIFLSGIGSILVCLVYGVVQKTKHFAKVSDAVVLISYSYMASMFLHTHHYSLLCDR
jgi:uncharacterized membrane protein YeiH